MLNKRDVRKEALDVVINLLHAEITLPTDIISNSNDSLPLDDVLKIYEELESIKDMFKRWKYGNDIDQINADPR